MDLCPDFFSSPQSSPLLPYLSITARHSFLQVNLLPRRRRKPVGAGPNWAGACCQSIISSRPSGADRMASVAPNVTQSSWCQSLSHVSTVSPKNMSLEHSKHSLPPYTSEHSLHVSDNAWLYVQRKENRNLRTTERGTGLIHGFVVIVASTLFSMLVFGTRNRDHTCGFTSVLTGCEREQQNQLVGGRFHYT